MASKQRKKYIQFYANPMSNDIIKAGKRTHFSGDSQAYNKKACAYYYRHTRINDEHTLNIYILPTDNPDVEGVQCTVELLTDIPLPGIAYLDCISGYGSSIHRQNPYLARHPHLGDICVLPKCQFREETWKTHIKMIELPSTMASTKEIKTFMQRMSSSFPLVFPKKVLGPIIPKYMRGINPNDLHLFDRDVDEITGDSNIDSTSLTFIAGKLEIRNVDKKKCFEHFYELFSLSCLYVEYEICNSLKQQGKHGFAECLLCKRINQNEDSREIKLVWSKGMKDNIRGEVMLRTELLFDLKAIGYSIYGSSLIINDEPYPEISLADHRKPFHVAIEKGEVSWIQAFIAVGIELKNESPAALAKFALDRAPISKQIQILEVLVSNGLVAKQDTHNMLHQKAEAAIHQDDHMFLKGMILKSYAGVVLDESLNLMSLINEAAKLCHHRCLKVRKSTT